MAKKIKRTLPSKQKQKQAEKLIRETQRNISEVNSKLQSLSRKNNVKNVWATRVLNEKLDSASLKKLNLVDKNGRLKRLPKNLTKGQLNAINKATENFLMSETSTKKGIRKAEQKARDSIKQILGDDEKDIEITNDEAESYRRFFWDKDFNNVADKMGYRETMKLLKMSAEHNDSKKEFMNRIEKYLIVGNDVDMKNSLTNLYNKFVRS